MSNSVCMINNKHKPLVSVIVPNYNHAKYLDQRLTSILNQTYDNFELIFLDDLSPDNSMEVAEKYKSDPRFTSIVKNDVNSGCVFRQWEKGIKLAKGELVWIAESDDYCESTILEKLVDKFEKYPNLSYAFSSSVWVNEFGEPLNFQNYNADRLYSSESFLKRFLLFENSIFNASCALFNKQMALKCFRFVNYISSGDYMFWIEMAMQGDVFAVAEGLNYFRRHTGCLTGKKMLDGLTYREDYEIASFLKQNIKTCPLRNKLSMLYKVNILLGLDFKTEETKKELVDLWGGPMTKTDALLLGLMQKLRIKYHVFL